MSRKLVNKYGPSVVGEEFFDREKEVKRLTRLIDEGKSILLVAPRRVGKTSLVLETFRRLEERNQDHVLFVDIQDCSTPQDVIVTLSMAAKKYNDLWEKVKGIFEKFFKQLKENVESFGSSELFEIKLREGMTGDWQAKGNKILAGLAEADKPIVICLDELPIMLTRLLGKTDSAEYEKRHHEADIFLSWLRHIMGEFQGKLRFIVCGSIGLEPIVRHHKLSRTITQLQPLNLYPWNRKTAEECLEALAAQYEIVWKEEAKTALLDLLVPYIPHHVQMCFGHIYEDCYTKDSDCPTVQDVTRVYHNSILSTRGHAELADYEERLLRVLEPKSVRLALDLLTDAAVTGKLTAQNARYYSEKARLDDPESTLREVLDILQHDGYLEYLEDEGGWAFSSTILKDWWKRRFGESYTSLRERN